MDGGRGGRGPLTVFLRSVYASTKMNWPLEWEGFISPSGDGIWKFLGALFRQHTYNAAFVLFNENIAPFLLFSPFFRISVTPYKYTQNSSSIRELQQRCDGALTATSSTNLSSFANPAKQKNLKKKFSDIDWNEEYPENVGKKTHFSLEMRVEKAITTRRAGVYALSHKMELHLDK